MPKLNPSQVAVVTALKENFFEVVPEHFKSFCALNASIVHHTLARFSITSTLQPCQLWCATPTRNVVIGFIHETPLPGRWDGHVVCTAKDWLVDAALIHLRREFDIHVPDIVAIPRFHIRSQTIARADLDATNRLWWLNPPPGIDATPPHEPEEVIRAHADKLFHRIRAKLVTLLPFGLGPALMLSDLTQDMLPPMA